MAEYLSTRQKVVLIENLSVDIGCYNSQFGSYTVDWTAQTAKGHIPERFFIFTWNGTREIRFEEIKAGQEAQLSISNLGLAR